MGLQICKFQPEDVSFFDKEDKVFHIMKWFRGQRYRFSNGTNQCRAAFACFIFTVLIALLIRLHEGCKTAFETEWKILCNIILWNKPEPIKGNIITGLQIK